MKLNYILELPLLVSPSANPVFSDTLIQFYCTRTEEGAASVRKVVHKYSSSLGLCVRYHIHSVDLSGRLSVIHLGTRPFCFSTQGRVAATRNCVSPGFVCRTKITIVCKLVLFDFLVLRCWCH